MCSFLPNFFFWQSLQEPNFTLFFLAEFTVKKGTAVFTGVASEYNILYRVDITLKYVENAGKFQKMM